MEQMTVSVTKYKEHSEEVYQAWKDVWNEYSKEEGEDELTPDVFCLSEVGTYDSNTTWNNTFRYPVLNIENLN